MTDILQVLLGLALVNYLMLDVLVASAKPASAAGQLHKTLVITGSTSAAFVVTLVFSALLDQLLVARFANGVVSTLSFCVLLAAVLQCIALLLGHRDVVSASSLRIFLPVIFANCVVMGLTMPADNTELDSVLSAGLLRSAGFALVLTGFTMLRDRLSGADIPMIMRGAPTTFITAAFLSMIFMGFAGLA